MLLGCMIDADLWAFLFVCSLYILPLELISMQCLIGRWIQEL